MSLRIDATDICHGVYSCTVTEGGYDTCLHKTWIITFNVMVAR